MKNLAIISALLMVFAPFTVSAYTLTINGVQVTVSSSSDLRIVTTPTGVSITAPGITATRTDSGGGGGTPPPDSDNDGIPDTEDNCPQDPNSGQADTDNDGIGNVCDSVDNTVPAPPPTAGSCNADDIPANVVEEYPVSWEKPVSRITYSPGTKVIASHFSTGLKEGVNGKFSFASTWDSKTIRKIWISECPGGPPLPGQKHCEKSGGESVIMKAAQRSDFTGHYDWTYGCGLDLDSSYYLNVEAETCTRSSCGEVAREMKYY